MSSNPTRFKFGRVFFVWGSDLQVKGQLYWITNVRHDKAKTVKSCVKNSTNKKAMYICPADE